MPYFEYGRDILQDVLFRAGEKTDLVGILSDYFDRTKVYIQRVYKDILGYAPWPWAIKNPPGVLNIEKARKNTLTVDNGSTSATLGSSVPVSLAGYFVFLDDGQVPYRILAHNSGTAEITLDAPFKELSVSGAPCTIFKDEYQLPEDCLKIWSAWDRNNIGCEVDIINPEEMRRNHPNRLVSGNRIQKITLIRSNIVRIYPWPLFDDITLEYDYTVKPTSDLTFDASANDIPIVPLVDRHVIADAALVLLMIDKNDARASDVSNIVAEKLNLMQQTYINPGKPRLYIRQGQRIWR